MPQSSKDNNHCSVLSSAYACTVTKERLTPRETLMRLRGRTQQCRACPGTAAGPALA